MDEPCTHTLAPVSVPWLCRSCKADIQVVSRPSGAVHSSTPYMAEHWKAQVHASALRLAPSPCRVSLACL
jgi:hypothetical protein